MALVNAAEKELNKPASSSNTAEANSFSDNHHSVLLDLIAKELGVGPETICDFELCLYDTQNASIGGANNEFIHAARLDNLMMSFCGTLVL